MTAGILALLIVGLLTYNLISPFLKRSERVRNVAVSREALEDQLAQMVQSVKDLDMDYDMGKVSKQDYQTHRKYLIGRGVSLLMKLDVEQDIENLIAQKRKEHA